MSFTKEPGHNLFGVEAYQAIARAEGALRPLAARSEFCGGRFHPEEGAGYRTDFQRDRDRIIHTQAFRRLEYKTQVFVNQEGDHYRTRLTHTIEVSQIARTMARVLGLNEDLTETIALGHDLGHPPFGHAGERALNRAGGELFEHNRQSVRVVELLEKRYPFFDGVNLTKLTLRGLSKHGRFYDDSALLAAGVADWPNPLESEVADRADSIAYCTHDLDDGLEGGYLELAELEGLALWPEIRRRESESGIKELDPRPEVRVRYLVRNLIHVFIYDLLKNSQRELSELERQGLDFAGLLKNGAAIKEKKPGKWVGLSPEGSHMLADLKNFLHRRLYNHERVVAMSRQGQKIIEDLYEACSGDNELVPETFFRPEISRERAVLDYLAGMTDRYAVRVHQRIFGQSPLGDW